MIGVLVPLAVSFYYTYIEAWCLGYFWHYLTGGIGVDAAAPIAEQTAAASQFYSDLTGRADNGIMTGGTLETFVFWVITFAVNIWLVYRGLSKGIEKFCSWAMPAMAVCAVIVLVRVLTLGTPDPAVPEQNVVNGLGYMWNPNFEALANPQTWLAAAGQIFFTLSVGFGVIINYASYLRKKDDVVLSGLTASATNEVFEVGFGGLITLTAAFVFLGTSNMIAAVQGGTFGLGFTTLPVVFAHMGALGNVDRRGLVLHALPGRDHQLDLDVPARARLLRGGARLEPQAGHLAAGRDLRRAAPSWSCTSARAASSGRPSTTGSAPS